MRIILSDYYRSFTSKKIYILLFFVIIVCVLSLGDYIKYIMKNDDADVIYFFNLLLDIGIFKNMIILFAAGTCSAFFCDDWNNRYINSMIVRSDNKKYCISKFITSGTITFIVSFLGILLFCLFISLFIPLYNDYSYEESLLEPYGFIITKFNPWLYIIIKIFNFSISCSFWSLLGITVSTFKTDKFLALVSPFIGYYLLSEISECLPGFLKLRLITYSYDIIDKPLIPTLLYTISFWTILSTILLIIFIKNLKRRFENEIC